VAQAKDAARGHKKKDLSKGGVPGKKNNIKNMLIGMSSKNREVCFFTLTIVLGFLYCFGGNFKDFFICRKMPKLKMMTF
jgi:hypothetical protein